MAARKKSTKIEEENNLTTFEAPVENATTEVATDEIVSEVKPEKKEKIIKKSQKIDKKPQKLQKTQKIEEKRPKYPIGSIVFVSKDAQADLNGFKLFSPYKKYTYTVEAYNDDTGVYSLRRLNLSLRLKEADIVAPSERAHDSLNRKQF